MAENVLESIWSTYKALRDQVDWSSVTVCAGVFLTTWLVYKLGMKPFLSPLRKVPGLPYNPFVGNLPELMRGERIDVSLKMIEKCGPIYRFYLPLGNERLGLADPDAIRHVTITNCRNYIKPTSRLALLRLMVGNGLLTSEGETHAVHKRLMSPAFNNQSIAKLIPAFEKRVLQLVEFWKRKVTSDGKGEVTVSADLARTTLDVIGDTAFGYDFNSLEKPDSEVSKSFQDISSEIVLSYRMFLPFYYNLPFPDALRARKSIKIMKDVVQNIIKHKRELLTKGTGSAELLVTKDVLGMMMMARDEASGQGLSDVELQDEVMTLMLAGHETTAVAMSWCLLMLASNPEVQEKARQEVLDQLEEDEPLTFDSVEKLSYCGHVVKETLRLLPPVPITIREAVKADVLPGDITVPAGTIMVLDIGAMMRRPEIYEDPNSFRPERFEDQETDSTFHHFLPFLIGSRMCLGYKFALIELRVMLAILLRHLRFDVIPGIEFKKKMALTMKPNPPLRLRVAAVV